MSTKNKGMKSLIKEAIKLHPTYKPVKVDSVMVEESGYLSIPDKFTMWIEVTVIKKRKPKKS